MNQVVLFLLDFSAFIDPSGTTEMKAANSYAINGLIQNNLLTRLFTLADNIERILENEIENVTERGSSQMHIDTPTLRKLVDILQSSLSVLGNVANSSSNGASQMARNDIFKCNVFGLGTRLLRTMNSLFEIRKEKVNLGVMETIAGFLKHVTQRLDSSKVQMLRIDTNG